MNFGVINKHNITCASISSAFILLCLNDDYFNENLVLL